MMDNANPIAQRLDRPHELEKLFRQDPEAFKTSFSSAWEQNPDSQVLAVWYERLHFKEEATPGQTSLFQKDFLMMGILAILAGIVAKVIFHFVDQQSIALVNFLFGILPLFSVYFMYQNRPQKKLMYIVGAAFFITGVYVNLLPLELKDSVVLAYLHLPVFLWIVVGLSFAGNKYADGQTRLAFLKFNGEFAILYACLAIGGILLTALTMALFRFINMDISEFYFSNVVVFGAAAFAIVAAYLVTKNFKLAKSIAPYIAKIFSPLVLTTLLAYLITIVVAGKNPFMDRDFLLSFNGVLLAVLVVTMFSITESDHQYKKKMSDYINFSLIATALIVDSIALSAIVFRLSSYGISPNRLAVLGVNVLVFANLVWILLAYIRFLRNKTGLSTVQNAVTKYLPIYGLWAIVVTITFPILFD